MTTLAECVWASQACAIRPASLWQIRLAEFVNQLEATWPIRKPRFDWNMYAGMPWAGEPTLCGMEFHSKYEQIPDYALQMSTDWKNKLRFFACFMDVGGHIMKCWTHLQVASRTRTLHFYNLIENPVVISDFVRMVKASYDFVPITPNMTNRLLDAITDRFPINYALEPYGFLDHVTDPRLFAAQTVDDPTRFKVDFCRWMMLSWAVDMLPPTEHVSHKAIVRQFKSVWKPLGEALRSHATVEWFESREQVVIPEPDFEDIYRITLNPLVHIANGKSSSICTMMHSTYVTVISEFAGKFDRDYKQIERIICTKATARVLNLFSQLLVARLTRMQNFRLPPNPITANLIENWLNANMRMLD